MTLFKLLFILAIARSPLLTPGEINKEHHVSYAPFHDTIPPSCYEVRVPTYEKSLIWSGYLPVNSKNTSALYYIFYGVKNLKKEQLASKPLVIWLNGGPGSSSQIGNFFELGPTKLVQNGAHVEEQEREISWNNVANLLIIDQPIDVGGSVAGLPGDLPENETRVAEHFFYALQQFYQLELGALFKSTPLYITGESYAGRYIPNIAKKIIDEGFKGIPLKGIAIGDGWTEPITIASEFGNYAFHLGAIDISDRVAMEMKNLKMLGLRADKYNDSNKIAGDFESLIKERCNCSIYNYRIFNEDYVRKPDLTDFLNRTAKERYHILKDYKRSSTTIWERFQPEFMLSDAHTVAYVLNSSSLKVLLYNGADDIIVNNPGALRWLERLRFRGNENFEFRDLDFGVWKLENGTVAGYFKAVGNLEFRIVLKAGHYVPTDQPDSALEMITKFLANN